MMVTTRTLASVNDHYYTRIIRLGAVVCCLLILGATIGCERKPPETVPTPAIPQESQNDLAAETGLDLKDPVTGRTSNWGIKGTLPKDFPTDIPIFPKSSVEENSMENPGSITLAAPQPIYTVRIFFESLQDDSPWKISEAYEDEEDDEIIHIGIVKFGKQVHIRLVYDGFKGITRVTYSGYSSRDSQ